MDNIDLVTIANINHYTFGLIRELVKSNSIEDSVLVNQIARAIVRDIEEYVDDHLKIYQKFTLNAAPILSSISTAQFFDLISLLKDVSILGRRLLELSPQFNAQESSEFSKHASISSNLLSDNKSISSLRSRHSRKSCDEDATSEDLIAALIESSSTDDFLILTSSLESISARDMILASLLYIKSHECFTLSHDIQSVVMILRRIKFIILNILAPKNQVELITKLLTSIGRYSEMTYVFDLFRDRNQFEVLLSKGVEKTPELRIALFNYVKKNPEYYALVTLNFSMFREIAESLEASAIKRLGKISSNKQKKKKRDSITTSTSMAGIATGRSSAVDVNCGSMLAPTNELSLSLSSSTSSSSSSGQKPLGLLRNQSFNQLIHSVTNTNQAATANSSTQSASQSVAATKRSAGNMNHLKENLNLSLVELVDASDCFAKAGCYKRSNNCEKKAKLIALQLAVLPDGTNVLDLQQSELNDLIINFDSFIEAYIIAEAYDYHLAWRQALFKNVIIRGDSTYLNDYCKRCDLSSSLVEGLVLLYKQYINNKSIRLTQDEIHNSANAMGLVLAKLVDVELRCKIYTQLNFNGAKEELLKDKAIEAHLKDLKLV